MKEFFSKYNKVNSMDKLHDLTISELIQLYNIVLHERGVLADEFYVADLIRKIIIDRLQDDAIKTMKEK